MLTSDDIQGEIARVEDQPDRGRDDLKLQKAHTLALLSIAYQLARIREEGLRNTLNQL